MYAAARHFKANATVATAFQVLAREAAAHAAIVSVRTRPCGTVLGDTRLLLRVCVAGC